MSGEIGIEDQDPSDAELLEWWNKPETKSLEPRQSLRTNTNEDFEMVCALYDQYRLTHSSTTGAILAVARQHFGSVHESRLKAWGGFDSVNGSAADLSPIIDGQYQDREGTLRPIPSGGAFVKPPKTIELLHLGYTDTFIQFLKSGSSTDLTKRLQQHGAQYQSLWEEYDKDHADQPSLRKFDRTLDWRKIVKTLDLLRNHSTKNSTTTKFKRNEGDWKAYAKSFGFPEQWDNAVNEMIKHKQPVVHKSKWQPNVSIETDHEDDGKDKSSLDASTDPHDVQMSERMDDDVQSNRSLDVKMRDASAASSTRSKQDQVDDISDALDNLVIVQDQGKPREVFAFLHGRGSQLFLKMTPPGTLFALYDIVSVKTFYRSLQSVTDQPDRGFSKMKGGKADLTDMDFADLVPIGIATQRRGKEPPGGWAAQPRTYVICKKQDGAVTAFTRSDLGDVFGRDPIDDEIYRYRIEAGGLKALPAPCTRRSKAIQYDLHCEGDADTVDSGDDLKFTKTHPDDVRLLQNEAQPEQREMDEMMKDIRRLGKTARFSSRQSKRDGGLEAGSATLLPGSSSSGKQGKQRESSAMAGSLPNNAAEAEEMLQLVRAFYEQSDHVGAKDTT
ncbi:hypothetical protein LTR91_025795 [Friedmanniomyces endolithicus]|uniref:Uncharacterized protein n=1 Tax=Friedmanniomyces endolithicus TaxID=329885 RepID=A0AAN6GY46_9PEZI|nr:hypothetical protein LTR91_025795 [Friedmanniomyces endolithicus]